jgi:hypothetical protein
VKQKQGEIADLTCRADLASRQKRLAGSGGGRTMRTDAALT